jgi:hypothetical protein
MGVRPALHPTLQVAHRARAQAGARRQLLLAQADGQAVAAEELAKG